MHLKRNEGFTLVEVVASIVILTIVLTVFMKFFAQAAMFANKNEEMLSASNEAREVLSLIQENNRALDILISNGIYITGTTNVSPGYKIDKNDSEALQQLLFPAKGVDDITASNNQTIQNTTLNFEDGPDNLIKVAISLQSPKSNVKSSTYGYIQKTSKTLFHVKDFPTVSDPTKNKYLNINTGIEQDIFKSPENYGTAFIMENSTNRPPGSTITEIEYEKGDFTFMKLKRELDEYSIKANVLFTSPFDHGGFGILVDGTLIEPADGSLKSQTNYMIENGFLLSFLPTPNGTIELSLRKNGTRDNWIEISKTINNPTTDTTSNKKMNLEEEITIIIKAEFATNPVENPLSTKRKYTVMLEQAGKEPKSFVFEDDTIDLSKIVNFDPYNKYIGLRLWSELQESETDGVLANQLKVYR